MVGILAAPGVDSKRADTFSSSHRGSFATARVATERATGDKVAIKTLMRNHENFDQELCE